KYTRAGARASQSMSFFITSRGPGDGANLGGLAGADAHCAALAEAVGVTGREWRAYLSTTATDGAPAVNARDRIGSGPWYNARGVLIARNVTELHSEKANLNKQASLNERGEMVNGRGDRPNRHASLTGSQPDGTAFPPGEDTTCSNWTSRGAGSAQVGHHDRTGGGQNPTSWNSAHASRGCSQENLRGTGGDGLFYCFAADAPAPGGAAAASATNPRTFPTGRQAWTATNAAPPGPPSPAVVPKFPHPCGGGEAVWTPGWSGRVKGPPPPSPPPAVHAVPPPSPGRKGRGGVAPSPWPCFSRCTRPPPRSRPATATHTANG